MEVKEIVKSFSDEKLITLIKDHDFFEAHAYISESSTLKKVINEEIGVGGHNFILMAHALISVVLREFVKRRCSI